MALSHGSGSGSGPAPPSPSSSTTSSLRPPHPAPPPTHSHSHRHKPKALQRAEARLGVTTDYKDLSLHSAAANGNVGELSLLSPHGSGEFARGRTWRDGRSCCAVRCVMKQRKPRKNRPAGGRIVGDMTSNRLLADAIVRVCTLDADRAGGAGHCCRRVFAYCTSRCQTRRDKLAGKGGSSGVRSTSRCHGGCRRFGQRSRLPHFIPLLLNGSQPHAERPAHLHQSDNLSGALTLHLLSDPPVLGLVKYALMHGQPINSVLNGVLPLHAGASSGNVEVVKMLIEHGADVNAPRCVS